MTPNSYQAMAIRTESLVAEVTPQHIRLLHAALGLSSELAELQIAYNGTDDVNLMEEAGDFLWYGAVLMDALEIPLGVTLVALNLPETREKAFFQVIDSVGEINDLLKKLVFYGKEEARGRIPGHLTRMFAGLEFLLLQAGTDLDHAMERNIAKLKRRYPDGFTAQDALSRNTQTERQELEG